MRKSDHFEIKDGTCTQISPRYITDQVLIQTANLDITRKPPVHNEVADMLGGRRSIIPPGPQRRAYHQYNPYPPESFWQRHKSSIVVGSVVGVCCAGFVASWWAQQRAENFHDYKPLTFIRENFFCSLENVRAGRWWVVLSSSITHLNILHLGVNMLTLRSFGPALIELWGVPAFVGIWLISALCCSAASLWWEKRQQEARVSSMGRRWDKREIEKRRWFVPKGGADAGVTYGGSIGASGALCGMVGAVTCFRPNASIRIFPLPVGFRIWAYTAAFSCWSLYCLDSGACPRISHSGHLGGLVGGMASYYGVIRPWLRRMPRF